MPKYGWGNPNSVHEAALENARQFIAPHAVSRLNAVYACTSIESANAFMSSNQRHVDQIYPIMHEGSRIMISDMSLSRPSGDWRTSWANDYWTSSLLVYFSDTEEELAAVTRGLPETFDIASMEFHYAVASLMGERHFTVYHAVNAAIYPHTRDLPQVVSTLVNAEILSDNPIVVQDPLQL